MRPSTRSETKDRLGRPVRVGSRVRIVAAPALIQSLPVEERERVSEMLGQTFEVEEIDEAAQAWVSKTWPSNDGIAHHAIGLASSEMEIVEPLVF